MGWRGTLRSIAATSRRIEREQQRRHRELLKNHKQTEKLESQERAALEVAMYENHIALLTSVHKDCGETWNWQQVKNSLPPPKPEYSNQLELAERQREAQHQPGFIDRLLGRTEPKRAASERAIEEAIAADKSRHSAAIAEFQTKLTDWESLQRIAKGVLSGEVSAFKEALEELNPLHEIRELGRSVQLNFNERYVEATIALHGIDHMPTEAKSLLKSGKVSIKKMTPSAVNELYETHCCSCLLRGARELFAALPFGTVYAHGLTELLNPRTGLKDLSVILSVCIPRATIDKLNLEAIEPVEAMRNFICRVDFARARGFAIVHRLDPKTMTEQVES
jgi:hypothetical protein